MWVFWLVVFWFFFFWGRDKVVGKFGVLEESCVFGELSGSEVLEESVCCFFLGGVE